MTGVSATKPASLAMRATCTPLSRVMPRPKGVSSTAVYLSRTGKSAPASRTIAALISRRKVVRPVHVAAVAILAAVEGGALELMEQLGVAAGELDAVVAGLAGPGGDQPEALRELFDLGGAGDVGVAAAERAQPQREAARRERGGAARRGELAVPALHGEQAAVAELNGHPCRRPRGRRG